jgi:Mg2+/Co2+ transporter CorC
LAFARRGSDNHRRSCDSRGAVYPDRGQSFTFHGFRFRVLRRERNRITALRIVPLPRDSDVLEKKPKAGTAF